MVLPADAAATMISGSAFCNANHGLNGHQEGRQQHDPPNAEGNVGVALELGHEVEQANLSHERSEDAHNKADDGVVRHEEAKGNERGCGSEAREEDHAGRRRA